MLEIFERDRYLKLDITSRVNAQLADSIDAWKGFLSLPAEAQAQFSMSSYESDWANPGYFDRTSRKGADRKRFYHYSSANDHLLFGMGKMQLAYDNERVQRFFSSARRLHRMARELIIARHEILGIDPLQLMQQTRFLMLRFLHYNTQESGVEIASRHFDLAGLTTHLFPHDEELEYWDGQDWRKFYPKVQPGDPVPIQAMMFPGYQAWSATQGKVKPCIHRVTQPSGKERIAVVAFCPFTFSSRFHIKDKQEDWCQRNGLDWYTSIHDPVLV